MTPITAEDLPSWGDPDDLLESLYALGEQTRRQPASTELTSAVAALLDHEDEDIRQEALRLLLVQWKAHQLHSEGLRLLRRDPSEDVRGTAAYGIASICADDRRPDDVRTLLEILLDESEAVHVRGAAYDALLIIHRRTTFPPMSRDLDPASDVDWEWVKTLQGEISAEGADAKTPGGT